MKLRKRIVRRLFSYTPAQLEATLKTMGLAAGDTILMHSAFRTFNGFAGTPDQVIACVLNVIGPSGNLVMMSAPYMGSTAAYLRTGVPFDVQRTPSAMGVITEIFRQRPGAVRSLNPATPLSPWDRRRNGSSLITSIRHIHAGGDRPLRSWCRSRLRPCCLTCRCAI